MFIVGTTIEDAASLGARVEHNDAIDVAGVASVTDIESRAVRLPAAIDAVIATPRAWGRARTLQASVDLPRPVERLTPREQDVLALAADGLSNREIALELDISEHTVKFHLASVFGKLGASSRTEAVRRGLQLGLVDI